MAAGTYDLYIEQGATFGLSITMTAANAVFDLTGWTPRAMLRKKYTDATATEEFICAANTTTGIVSVGLSPDETANIAAGSYVWDLEIAKAANADVRRILQGAVVVSPEVTK